MPSTAPTMSESLRVTAANTPFSPVVLADILISLAEAADRAGYAESASNLVAAACAVLGQKVEEAA